MTNEKSSPAANYSWTRFFLTTAKSSSEDTWFYTFVKIKPNTSIAANDADKSCDVESLAVLMILSQP